MAFKYSKPLLFTILFVVPPAGVSATHAPPSPDVAQAARISSQFIQNRQVAWNWYVTEKQLFTSLLSAGHFDYLVVPAQTQREGFDRAERSMMTSEVARAIIEQQASIPDPYLVEHVLGMGRREDSLDDIDVLARQLRVRVIVVPYVGHDDSGTLWATLAVYRKSDDAVSITQIQPTYVTTHTRFDDTVAPVESFVGVLPELLTELAIPAPRPHAATSPPALPSLPNSPELLGRSGDENPLEDAARFAVLGAIAPPGSRAAEHLFERCLLAAFRAPASPQQAFLQAYALFRLNLRLAALHTLRETRTPGRMALEAIVNGNLTGSAALVGRTSGYERLILEFEIHTLARAYGHAADIARFPPLLTALADRSAGWNVLLHRQWDFGSEQVMQSNVVLKKLLDQIFPVTGKSLNEMLQAEASTPGRPFDEMDLELSAHEHVRQLLSDQSPAWCCARSFDRPGPWDFLSVLDAWSDANLVSAVERELVFRGLPDEAQQILSRLDPKFSGHPAFELLHAQTDLALASGLPQAQQGTLRASARAHALQAFVAAAGQTAEGVAALGILGPDPETLRVAHAYGNDYPFNELWLSNDFAVDHDQRSELAQRALANSQTGVGYATLAMLDGNDAVKPALRALVSGRFRGNPGLDAVLAQLESSGTPARNPGLEAVIAKLRGKVRAEPDVWEARTELSGWLLANRRYAEAARVLADYPPFRQSEPSNPVYLSNIAAEEGHKFYWQGAEHEARRLYKIATRYKVGSDAEMSAAIHTRLLDDDLSGALKEAWRRAERYPGGASYNYYLSLLHLLGQSQAAWKTFDLLVGQPLGPGPWGSAMVGLRMAGTTEADLERWTSRPDIAAAGNGAVSWPASFLLIWSMTDRVADAALAEHVASLGHEPTGRIEGDGRMALYPGTQPGFRYVVVRSDFRADQRPSVKNGTTVPSGALLFARALIPLTRGNFAEAVSRFDELAARYPIEREVENGDAVYALPEFAYASAKAGDPLQLEHFLQKIPAGTQFFELALARAYFQGIGHRDDDGALEDLLQGFVLIENDLGRVPSMQYQYAEAAERLYQATGDKRFRDRAATWAHLMQRLEPWSAWAYAMEAELVDDPAVRRAALVKAIFLDPLSPRLSSIPSADLDWARIRVKNGNPFLRPVTPSKDATQRTAQVWGGFPGFDLH